MASSMSLGEEREKRQRQATKKQAQSFESMSEAQILRLVLQASETEK